LRRRKSNSFAELGTLFLAVVVALMLSGMGYGVWSDTISITGTMKTGSWGVGVTGGSCSNSEVVSCSGSGEVLTVTLTSAPEGGYWCDFTIANTGNVPIQIVDEEISALGGVAVTSIVYEGSIEQIDEGGEVDGRVNFTVTGEVSGSFTVKFIAVPWNQ
jgi:hypothetical protein